MNKNPVFSRLDKINSLLLHELDSLLGKDPFEKNGANDVLLSFTKIETSKDLRSAKVFFTILPEKYRGEAKHFLDLKSRGWQRVVGDRLTLKYTPRLHFFLDEGQQNAFTVEEILNKIHKK